jgi:hypothetical protein
MSHPYLRKLKKGDEVYVLSRSPDDGPEPKRSIAVVKDLHRAAATIQEPGRGLPRKVRFSNLEPIPKKPARKPPKPTPHVTRRPARAKPTPAPAPPAPVEEEDVVDESQDFDTWLEMGAEMLAQAERAVAAAQEEHEACEAELEEAKQACEDAASRLGALKKKRDMIAKLAKD